MHEWYGLYGHPQTTTSKRWWTTGFLLSSACSFLSSVCVVVLLIMEVFYKMPKLYLSVRCLFSWSLQGYVKWWSVTLWPLWKTWEPELPVSKKSVKLLASSKAHACVVKSAAALGPWVVRNLLFTFLPAWTRGLEVIQLFPENSNMGKALPE